MARSDVDTGRPSANQQLMQWAEAFAARTRGDVGAGIVEILAMSGATDVISLSGGFPDPATFPGHVLAELLSELIDRGDPSPFQYGPTPGLPGPRDYLASRLEALEGLQPADDELLVTSGAVECLELVGKSFLDPGDLVLVEGPTYLGAIMSFRSFQADVRAVPLDQDGLDIDALRAAIRRAQPKLLYTIPDHQNPAGVSLSIERRTALVELARRQGFLVVEDVAYRELSFHGDRPPSLWSLGSDAVLQCGTFSKTFFPGVRLGWAAGPAEVIRQLTAAKQLTDQCASPLAQRLLEEYGRRGHLDRGVDHARELYGRRAELLLGALDRHLGGRVTWTIPRGGFFSWLALPEGLDSAAVARRAVQEGVSVVPGQPFFPDGRGGGNIRLAFSRVDDRDIEDGVSRLAAAIPASGGAQIP